MTRVRPRSVSFLLSRTAVVWEASDPAPSWSGLRSADPQDVEAGIEIDMTQFHGSFFDECADRLADMDGALTDLDPAEPDDELVNLVFRSAHSIKGGAETFGFEYMSRLARVVERLFDGVRGGSRELSQEAIDLTAASVECVRYLVECRKNGDDADGERVETLTQRLEALEGA